ncbi:helix-turn-helix domain-containing protein [Xylella fastidiosa]|uniref:helix-turn-helix domain-containing protein n=1 Tax=Xylella fastidiosa TaxID=2371 RepID=UPI001E4AFC61|nr:helix-turn-helix transcriptional regulator [Xylella fastidiosa]
MNLTQEQLAKRLGVSFATVNRWESGGNTPQHAAQQTILALAQEAGVQGTESPPPTEAAAQVTRRRTGRAATATARPQPSRWSRCCGMPPVRSAARRTQPSSRITCCPCSS